MLQRAALAGMILLALALALAASAGVAHAYPQFQLSTGAARCNQCHLAPAGGGLLSSYGRDEAGETISRGGNGEVLHGAWTPPAWFAFGADLRLAGLASSDAVVDGPELAAFPMQTDLYTSFKWRSFSLSTTLGLRASPRERPGVSLLSRVISREHYLMWRPRAQGPYARVGRFFAPFGLRLVEHPAWVRRESGFNLNEETYGVSGGVVKNGWEAHFTPLFVADPLRCVGLGCAYGTAMYAEKRLGAAATVGVQGKIAVRKDDRRFIAGALYKRWFAGPRLLLMAEADLVRHLIERTPYDETQLIGYVGVTHFVTRGLLAAVSVERFDEDLPTPGVARDAVNLQVNYFPWAHFEAVLYGRVTDTEAKLLMLQLHYYL